MSVWKIKDGWPSGSSSGAFRQGPADKVADAARCETQLLYDGFFEQKYK